MHVLLLGATGRTGKQVLRALMLANHHVIAVVRDEHKVGFVSERLTVLEGDTRDGKCLREAMNGCEAVISVLNISRTSDFPWAKLRTPKMLLSDTMANLLQIADPAAIRKVIICSAWGVHETNADLPGWFRWLIDNSNIGVAYRDHERQEVLICKSELNYTIVRPVGLTHSSRHKAIAVSIDNTPKPKLFISRKSVAEFIVRLLDTDDYVRKAITIFNP